MAFTPVLPGSTAYPSVLLEWAPTSKPTDASQTYVDITSRLRDWEWGYGRNDELARFEAGTGYVLLDNRDRALDPTFNAGPWFGNVKPRKMFRLRYQYAGVTYPGFVAYARGFPQAWPSAGADSVVKVDLVDAFAILQGIDLVTGFTRGVERSDVRIGAVLDAVGIPAALRDLDVGTVDVAALTVTDAGTSGLDHARSVAADAEFGALFVAKDGKVTFHNRWRRLNQTSLWTFTDNPGGLRRYAPDMEPAYDETYLWNYLTVAGPVVDDVAATSTDAASVLDYHTLVRPVTSPLAVFNDRQALADYEIDLYAQPALRAPSLPLQGASAPALMWPCILDLEVSDRVTVDRFATSSDPMSFVQNVEGVRHSCRPGGPWLTTVATSPADTTQYWALENATLGLLQSTTYVAP
jgi:hypothetical protein